MEAWILKYINHNEKSCEGYYTGKTHTHEGERYAVCNTNKENSKKYTSYKRALSAWKKLSETVVNCMFDVVRFSEE